MMTGTADPATRVKAHDTAVAIYEKLLDYGEQGLSLARIRMLFTAELSDAQVAAGMRYARQHYQAEVGIPIVYDRETDTYSLTFDFDKAVRWRAERAADMATRCATEVQGVVAMASRFPDKAAELERVQRRLALDMEDFQRIASDLINANGAVPA